MEGKMFEHILPFTTIIWWQSKYSEYGYILATKTTDLSFRKDSGPVERRHMLNVSWRHDANSCFECLGLGSLQIILKCAL